MAELSPAAKAVLTAITQSEYGLDPDIIPKQAGVMASIASAALRVAADHALEELELLAIADELEAM
jgi:hypothetical protein